SLIVSLFSNYTFPMNIFIDKTVKLTDISYIVCRSMDLEYGYRRPEMCDSESTTGYGQSSSLIQCDFMARSMKNCRFIVMGFILTSSLCKFHCRKPDNNQSWKENQFRIYSSENLILYKNSSTNLSTISGELQIFVKNLWYAVYVPLFQKFEADIICKHFLFKNGTYFKVDFSKEKYYYEMNFWLECDKNVTSFLQCRLRYLNRKTVRQKIGIKCVQESDLISCNKENTLSYDGKCYIYQFLKERISFDASEKACKNVNMTLMSLSVRFKVNMIYLLDFYYNAADVKLSQAQLSKFSRFKKELPFGIKRLKNIYNQYERTTTDNVPLDISGLWDNTAYM
ncbi:DgyrCDS3239, partial [Dimorphilus gyrociliatus]